MDHNSLLPVLPCKASTVLGAHQGDKNVVLAREAWPIPVLTASRFPADTKYAAIALQSGAADAIVYQKFDLLWGAHVWPRPIDPVVSEQNLREGFRQSDGFRIQRTNLASIVTIDPGFLDPSVLNGKIQYTLVPIAENGFGSQVGTMTDTGVQSTGKSGFLVFGPYMSLPKGKYRVSAFGEVAAGGEVTMDVASERGQNHLIRSMKQFDPTDGADILGWIEFELDERTDDIEFRLLVPETLDMMLLSFEIEQQ